MSRSEPSPTVRVLAMLFSMAAIGGLLGWGAERAVHAEAPDLTELEAQGDAVEPPRGHRTPEEEALLERSLSHFPPYPRGSRPQVLAADYLGPRAPIAVAWFSTRDSPRQVLEHYHQRLVEAGLPVIDQRHGGQAGYVGYWSPATEEVHLVSTLAQGGETLVFVSTGQVRPLLEGPGKAPEWLPLPARLERSLTLTLDMEGATQFLVSGTVPDSTLDAVESSLRTTLHEQGWRVDEARRPGAQALELEVWRDGLRGMVTLHRAPHAAGVQVHLSLRQRT
jgi:hypothetical protein